MLEYLVTDCTLHGVKVTTDLASQTVYRDAAHACQHETHFDPNGHLDDHGLAGSDCWVCCEYMRIADRAELITQVPCEMCTKMTDVLEPINESGKRIMVCVHCFHNV